MGAPCARCGARRLISEPGPGPAWGWETPPSRPHRALPIPIRHGHAAPRGNGHRAPAGSGMGHPSPRRGDGTTTQPSWGTGELNARARGSVGDAEPGVWFIEGTHPQVTLEWMDVGVLEVATTCSYHGVAAGDGPEPPASPRCILPPIGAALRDPTRCRVGPCKPDQHQGTLGTSPSARGTDGPSREMGCSHRGLPLRTAAMPMLRETSFISIVSPKCPPVPVTSSSPPSPSAWPWPARRSAASTR